MEGCRILKMQAKKPFLANREEVKPVEVMRRERNCPKARPSNVFLLQNCSKVAMFSYSPKFSRNNWDIIYHLRTEFRVREE